MRQLPHARELTEKGLELNNDGSVGLGQFPGPSFSRFHFLCQTEA
jgi:hypothetical protein